MANEAVRRLIAAGASPERARAFTQNVINKIQVPEAPKVAGIEVPKVIGTEMPKARGLETAAPSRQVPQGPSEWYSDDYATASASFRSEKGMPGWELPGFGSPDVQTYFDFSYGPGTYKKIEQRAFSALAPDYAAATKSRGYERFLAQSIAGGASIAQIEQQILKDEAEGDELLAAFPVVGLDGNVAKSASDYAKRLFNQYNKLQSGWNDYVGKLGTTYRDYRYDLPSAKLKYGTKNDYKAGTIDVLNNYWALTKYQQYEKKLKSNRKLTPNYVAQELVKYKTKLSTAVNKAGRTPLKDEKARRDALKD